MLICQTYHACMAHILHSLGLQTNQQPHDGIGSPGGACACHAHAQIACFIRSPLTNLHPCSDIFLASSLGLLSELLLDLCLLLGELNLLLLLLLLGLPSSPLRLRLLPSLVGPVRCRVLSLTVCVTSATRALLPLRGLWINSRFGDASIALVAVKPLGSVRLKRGQILRVELQIR